MLKSPNSNRTDKRVYINKEKVEAMTVRGIGKQVHEQHLALTAHDVTFVESRMYKKLIIKIY